MDLTKGNIKVVLEGRGPLTLRQNDHVATGGEGAIFRASNTALKIYLKPEKVVWNDVSGKITFFKANKHNFIVAPQGAVLDLGGKIIGYYMEFVDNGEPIARVFTNAFRNRSNFNNKNASILIEKMRQIVEFAHSNNALLIDANELGYFVIFNFPKEPEPRIIDVDSWVLENRFPPQVAIMPSIRDWHTNGWNQGTDWFAWGVVTFQVYIGIHPYKGTLDGYKSGDLEQRMKDNTSVFSPGIRLNQAVRDFSEIPGPLFDWYMATFQQGDRTIPPSPFDTGIARAQAGQILRAVTTATGMLVFEKIHDSVNDQVIRIFPCGVALLKSGKLIDLATKKQIACDASLECEVIQVQGGWLVASMNGNNVNYSYINKANFKQESLNFALTGYKLVRYENRLFLVTDRGLTEIILRVLNKPILSIGKTWGVMINSTQWFDGVGIQDAMGAMFVIVPFDDSACAQIRVKELDGLKPVVAKAGNRFVTIIGLDRSGNYQKVELTFDASYQNCKAWTGATDNPDLNIAILPKMVCVTIVQDREMVIFVPTSGVINKISDKQVSTNMILFNWEDKVVYIQDGNVWSVRMK